jgi:class I fructose-bisphosphate aldolase
LPSDFLEEDPTKAAFENNKIAMSTLQQRVTHIKKVAFEGKRLVVFSGGDAKDDSALMEEIKAIHFGGGNGSIIGRNCFQRTREDSLVLLDQMIQIYKSK